MVICRYESKFIEDIVKEVGNKLNGMVLNVAPYLVGINSRVKDINCWLLDGSSVNVATIYGIGGIGKTTIAKTVYNQNFYRFEGSSFLANVREALEKPNGLMHLQKQLIFDILKGKKKKINCIDAGYSIIKDVIRVKRILLVLDDVDQVDQLDAILNLRHWFCEGSKIIITTRHERLLNTHESCQKFKVNELNDVESLCLFSWHAFRQAHPTECYLKMAEEFVQHCGGIPLALQVLGSSLSGEIVDVWRSALKKLDRVFDSRIFKVLRTSYDSLDRHDKMLFLDITCFFVGKDCDFVAKVLDEYDFCPTVGIQNLANRCLITIDEDKKLRMHQLLQDMGREIICQESPSELGRRSRVWHHQDALKILREKTGSETIHGFILSMNELMQSKPSKTSSISNARKHQSDNDLDKLTVCFEVSSLKRRRLGLFSWLPINSVPNDSFSTSSELKLETDAFSRMSNIKLLQLNYARISGGKKLTYAGLTGSFEEFPRKLRWLSWRGFPLECIPSNFHMETLVALDMRHSNLVRVWKETKFLRFMKILNLSHSNWLTNVPNLSGVPNLERLILKYCIRLVEVHESIGDLVRLTVFNLKGCKNLAKLPSRICQLKSLEKLILSGSTKLGEFPTDQSKTESKKMVFRGDGVIIDQLPSAFADLKNQFKLSVKSLQSLLWSWVWPRSNPNATGFLLTFLPSSLKILSLADCNLTDGAVAILLSGLFSLQHLNLEGNPISCLPESIKGLTRLHSLILNSCSRLRSLPELPCSLEKLDAKGCTSLERITNLPNFFTILNFVLYRCDKLVEVQGLFKLEPIANLNTNIADDLGLVDMESKRNIEVQLCNNLAVRRKKGPIQGLYEFGIISTFLPGKKVPGWFSIKSTEPEIRFVVPSLDIFKIRGMTICIVYNKNINLQGENFLYVHNKSKGLRWNYSPTFIGRPGENEDMMWFSHWKFGKKMEGGDQVEIVVDLRDLAQMKECGVEVLYEKLERKAEVDTQQILVQPNGVPGTRGVSFCEDWVLQQDSKSTTSYSSSFSNKKNNNNNVIDGGDLSAYEMMNGAYWLCHHNRGFYQGVMLGYIMHHYEYFFRDYNHFSWVATHNLESPETGGNMGMGTT